MYINTYNFQIEDEFFGKVRKDINIGTTLEKATFTVIQQSRRKKLILCILCVGNEKGGSASLLCLSNKYCYIFDPCSRSSYGLPANSVISPIGLHLLKITSFRKTLNR